MFGKLLALFAAAALAAGCAPDIDVVPAAPVLTFELVAAAAPSDDAPPTWQAVATAAVARTAIVEAELAACEEAHVEHVLAAHFDELLARESDLGWDDAPVRAARVRHGE